MKIFTQITILTFVMFLTSMNVNAQTKQHIKKAREEADKLQFFLDLDDETTEEIHQIYLTTFAKIQVLNLSAKKGTITEIERKEQHRLFSKQKQGEIEKILDLLGPEKVKEYRIHRKKMREAKE